MSEDLPFDGDTPSSAAEQILEDIPLTPPPSPEFPVLPSNWYTAIITDAGVIEKKPEWQDPDLSPEQQWKNKQLQIDFEVEHEGETFKLRHWTSLANSPARNGKSASYMFSLLKALGFDPVQGPKPSELVGRKVRINVVRKEKDDGKVFNQVAGGQYESV